MIEIIKELDVEVTKPNIFQAIVAKQYDMNTRFLKVTLRDCGTRIDVPNIETAKVVINAERKDGQSKGFDGVINDDGTVTVPLHSWMLELEGTVICDISVMDIATDDNKKLTTTSFTLIVEKAAYGGDDITSDPQYDVLVELVETCSAVSVAAQEALDKSNEALEKSAEADSKYDACVEATKNANAVRAEIEAGGYIKSLKELNNGGKFRVWIGTQEEYETETNNGENYVPNCLYLTDKNTLDLIHPIGSIWIGGKNDGPTVDFDTGEIITPAGPINPSTLFGGEWELFDKEFKSSSGNLNTSLFELYNGTTFFVPNSENPIGGTGASFVRVGHNLRIRLHIVLGTKITDDPAINLLKVKDFSSLGIDGFDYTFYNALIGSDGGNAVLIGGFGTDGIISVADAIGKNSGEAASGNVAFIDITIPVTTIYMLDEFCDKFYWRRIG